MRVQIVEAEKGTFHLASKDVVNVEEEEATLQTALNSLLLWTKSKTIPEVVVVAARFVLVVAERCALKHVANLYVAV